MKEETKQAVIGLSIIAVLVATIMFFGGSSPASDSSVVSSLSPARDSVVSFSSDSFFNENGWTNPVHHSIPTKMSLQGKVTDFNSVPIPDANLQVKISDANSCTSQVFYDYTFPHAVQNGFFNLLLGQNEILPLNFNQDYFMCLYVNNQLLSSPQVFRGGQGEVHAAELFDGNSTEPFDFNYVRAIQYQCNLSSGSSCLSLPADNYAFTTSASTGLAFNNTPKSFSFDVSGERIMLINAGTTNKGMFSFQTRTTNPTNAQASGNMFVKDFQNSADGNQLMIRDGTGNYIQVGSYIAGDSKVTHDLNVGNKINWYTGGSNPCAGTVSISAGNSSSNVGTSCVSSTSLVFLTQQSGANSAGTAWVSDRNAGSSFTISTSDATNNRVIAWIIVEPQ